MNKLNLTLATSHYDHISRACCSGRVPVAGRRPDAISTCKIEEIFFRMVTIAISTCPKSRWRSSLAGLAGRLRRSSASRCFRRACRGTRRSTCARDGPVKTPADLKGKRIGVPEWAQTASVYSRGMLQHQYGVDLTSIQWIQAGVDQPGRRREGEAQAAVRHQVQSRAPTRAWASMLVSGEIDAALVGASAARASSEGHPNVARMFEDYLDLEMKYVQARPASSRSCTRSRSSARSSRSNPWVAVNLFNAFEEAQAPQHRSGR